MKEFRKKHPIVFATIIILLVLFIGIPALLFLVGTIIWSFRPSLEQQARVDLNKRAPGLASKIVDIKKTYFFQPGMFGSGGGYEVNFDITLNSPLDIEKPDVFICDKTQTCTAIPLFKVKKERYCTTLDIENEREVGWRYYFQSVCFKPGEKTLSYEQHFNDYEIHKEFLEASGRVNSE